MADLGRDVGTVRSAFPTWAETNRRFRDYVAAMTEEQLALRPTPDRWPLWATIGHTACQRVFWLCDFAGEPGAETTRYTDAGYDCPGDDDLEHVLAAATLAEDLAATFRIVDACLDRWTWSMLDEVLRPDWAGDWPRSRGMVLQRGYAHDISHISEINETLSRVGLPQIDLWE